MAVLNSIEVSIYKVFCHTDNRVLFDYMNLIDAYNFVKQANKKHRTDNFYFVIEIK